VNAVAELKEPRHAANKIALAFKEQRRVWFRDLLKELDVDQPDALATQLMLWSMAPLPLRWSEVTQRSLAPRARRRVFSLRQRVLQSLPVPALALAVAPHVVGSLSNGSFWHSCSVAGLNYVRSSPITDGNSMVIFDPKPTSQRHSDRATQTHPRHDPTFS
jgi:hypothetical protein